MDIRRRDILSLAAGATAYGALSGRAWAQTYPSRTVRIVVGFAAGGGVDIVARIVAEALSQRLGQQFVVENRPGAASNLATEAVVNAPADGYTLLLMSVSAAINASLYDRLNYSLLRDIVPVAAIMGVPGVMEVNPSHPARTVAEFVAFAKANPGRVNMASAGIGTLQHVCGEMFKMMTGIDMVHVPYRGSAPALTDLMGGQVHVTFDPLPSSIGHIREGKLRALAVTTATRAAALPDVPTVAEFVPGFEASAWYGVGAPKNTPATVVQKLNVEMNAALSDSKVKAQLEGLGRHCSRGFIRQVRRARRARSREMGQGDSRGKYQADVGRLDFLALLTNDMAEVSRPAAGEADSRRDAGAISPLHRAAGRDPSARRPAGGGMGSRDQMGRLPRPPPHPAGSARLFTGAGLMRTITGCNRWWRQGLLRVNRVRLGMFATSPLHLRLRTDCCTPQTDAKCQNLTSAAFRLWLRQRFGDAPPRCGAKTHS